MRAVYNTLCVCVSACDVCFEYLIQSYNNTFREQNLQENNYNKVLKKASQKLQLLTAYIHKQRLYCPNNNNYNT